MANYSATIDWGDGSSTSAGTITMGPVLDPPTGGSIPMSGVSFSVSGGHTQATAAGNYTFTVTISDTDGTQATVQEHGDVAEPKLLAHGLPVESQGLTINGTAVAAFVDTGGRRSG